MKRKQVIAVIILLAGPMLLMSAKDTVRDTLSTGKAVMTSPAELIKGEISGVRVSSIDGNPNGEFNVNIRGFNTLRGDSQPLWIVDGAVVGSSIRQNLNAFYMTGGQTIKGEELPDYSGESYCSPLGNFGWLNPEDIESVEILKDLSATALYGMKGANGVIIIKTKRGSRKSSNFHFSSNIGTAMPSQSGEAFRNGLIQKHEIGTNGSVGNNSYYNISAFYRSNSGAVQNTESNAGGLAVNFETMANNVFKFGLNSYLSYGDYTSTGGTNYIGAPSTMMLSRYSDSFADNKVAGWLKSYDDNTLDYRTVNSVWLRINFLQGFYLMVEGGMDYQNQTRYFWHGNETSFGKKYNGASGILSNSLINYNLKTELNFDRHIAVKHHLNASLAFDMNGYSNVHNSMCGTDFKLPFLRGKGLSSSSSKHAIYRFKRDNSRLGAYACISYDFDGYAGMTGMMRMDSNSRFDKEPVLFPAGEVFVDFKKIFFDGNDVLSGLTLKGGYGSAGMENAHPYEHLVNYISNIPEIKKGVEIYYEGVNRLLSSEYNIGLDLGFIHGRFNLSVKYFDKKTEDRFMIYNFGKEQSKIWVEAKEPEIIQERTSSIRNKGLEIDAEMHIIKTKDIDWSLYGNLSLHTNTVLSLDDLDASLPGAMANGTYIAANIVGESAFQAYGTEIYGNTIPKHYGGFGTTLRLYDLTLNARFSGAGGFNIINANKMVEKGADSISEDMVEKGDYLRLDRLSISYRIPLEIEWMQDFRVNLSAHNLLTFTDYSGWNPDVNCFGVNVSSHGTDYGSYPLIRSLVLGISLKF